MELGRVFSFLIHTQSVGLLGRWISPSQGPFLYTEQQEHRINAHRHPCLDWDSNPRSQCSRGRRRYLNSRRYKIWDIDSIMKWRKRKDLHDPLFLFLIESDLTTNTPCRNIYLKFWNILWCDDILYWRPWPELCVTSASCECNFNRTSSPNWTCTVTWVRSGSKRATEEFYLLGHKAI
jgi:hypothetical protein